MTHYLTVEPNGTTRIDVDFADEGVDLAGVTHVRGGEAEALIYLRVFEADLRSNYVELFPQPELVEGGDPE